MSSKATWAARLATWEKRIRAEAKDLAQHESRLYAVVAEFEADTKAWQWRGLAFDRLIESTCGIDSARYRAFCRAVELVGLRTTLDLGIDAAEVLRKQKTPEEKAAPLYQAVADRMRAFRRSAGHAPAKTALAKVVREESSRLGMRHNKIRPIATPFQILLGVVEKIANGDEPKASRLARQALATLEKSNAIAAA